MSLVWLFAVCVFAQAQTAPVLEGRATQEGRAAWIGTIEPASGVLQAAHWSLPLNGRALVRNAATGMEVEVVIAGRIPAPPVGETPWRVIDISPSAARAIGLQTGGYVRVYYPSVPERRALPPGVNVVVHNYVRPHPGGGISQVTRIHIPPGRATTPERRAAVVTREIERLGIQDVSVQVVDDGIMLSLEDIRFYAASAIMLPGETEKIDMVADILRLFPERNILVAGHTDGTFGTDTAGAHRLSAERAMTVAYDLISLNIGANRLVVRGYGDERQIADSATDEGRRRNRRVELTILDS